MGEVSNLIFKRDTSLLFTFPLTLPPDICVDVCRQTTV